MKEGAIPQLFGGVSLGHGLLQWAAVENPKTALKLPGNQTHGHFQPSHHVLPKALRAMAPLDKPL